MSPFWGRYPFSSEVPVTFSLSFSLSFVSLYSTSLEACQSPPGPQGCNSHAAPIPSVILTQGDLFNREIQTLSLPGVKSFSDSHHLLRKIQILGLHSWPVMRQLLPVFISCLNWTVFAEHHAVPCLCTCCSCCMQCPTPPQLPHAPGILLTSQEMVQITWLSLVSCRWHWGLLLLTDPCFGSFCLPIRLSRTCMWCVPRNVYKGVCVKMGHLHKSQSSL